MKPPLESLWWTCWPHLIPVENEQLWCIDKSFKFPKTHNTNTSQCTCFDTRWTEKNNICGLEPFFKRLWLKNTGYLKKKKSVGKLDPSTCGFLVAHLFEPKPKNWTPLVPPAEPITSIQGDPGLPRNGLFYSFINFPLHLFNLFIPLITIECYWSISKHRYIYSYMILYYDRYQHLYLVVIFMNVRKLLGFA